MTRLTILALCLLLASPAWAFTLHHKNEDANAFYFNYLIQIPEWMKSPKERPDIFEVTAFKDKYSNEAAARAYADQKAGEAEAAALAMKEPGK